METYIMYKFTCNDENIISSYVGHTKSLPDRKTTHKSRCNNKNSSSYNSKLYVEMRANGGWDNWTMTPLEEYKCDNKIQARIREQYHINLQAEKLNIHSAFTTAEEAQIKYKKTKLLYCNANAVTIKQKARDWYFANPEKAALTHKLYAETHPEQFAGYKLKYYLKNKDAILTKYECECGSSVCQNGIPRHIATLKHQQYILSQPIV